MISRRPSAHILIGCVASMTSLVACSPETAGLDADRLVSSVSSPTSTAWVAVGASQDLDTSKTPEDEIARAFDDLVTRRVECGREPSMCDVSTLAIEGSRVYQQLNELMNERMKAGIVASTTGRMNFEIESIDLEGTTRAHVTTCSYDDTVLTIESAVYDDSVYSARSVWTLVESEGTWLWSDEQVLEWIMEGNLCEQQ